MPVLTDRVENPKCLSNGGGILHLPNLGTVLMVEQTLMEADGPISKSELERRLPRKVMHQTLKVILEYLEDSGKVFIGKRGIDWTFKDNLKLQALIDRAVTVR